MADTDTDTDTDVAPLTSNGSIPRHAPHGTLVDRWQCPSCDRTIDITHRAGRPRLYCSQACRQRMYRWRRQHRTHTTATLAWPAEAAYADSHEPTRSHALRTPTDPLAHRHDRRRREVTVCGLLARTRRQPGITAPFLPGGLNCRTWSALIQPRPHGLVPPNATPPPYDPATTPLDATIDLLHAVHRDYPLHPQTRHLLATVWLQRPSRSPAPPRPTGSQRRAA